MKTTRPTHQLQGLFAQAQRDYALLIEELATYGLLPEVVPDLKQAAGLLCHYDHATEVIYLSVPDEEHVAGTLQTMFMRSLTGCKDNAELAYLVSLLLRRLLAHELGHYLRYHHGCFGEDLWHEEQVANLLANALTKNNLAPHDRAELLRMLRRAVALLSELEVRSGRAANAYHDPIQALHIAGEVDLRAVDDLKLIKNLFQVDPVEALKHSGHATTGAMARLATRADVIARFNEDYTNNVIAYLHDQLSWMLLDLESRENNYVDEFAREHLGVVPALLPAIPPSDHAPDDRAIRATFQAYRDVEGRSLAAYRYFYKRYRSLLLLRLQSERQKRPSLAALLRKETRGIIESWDDDDADKLGYLMQMAPATVQPLFPMRIAETMPSDLDPGADLPTETDRALWAHLVEGRPDSRAAHTLSRLTLLDQAELYRALPAEILVELTRSMVRVRYGADDHIIWEGVENDDLFILIRGKLNVLMHNGADSRPRVVATIGPGQVFGEMSFLTHLPRSATVRADGASECFVLKSSDFRVFAYEHPVVLLHLARVLAQRLGRLQQHMQ